MVRFARYDDMEFLKHTWKVCFNDPDLFIDWNFKNNFDYADTIVAEVEGEPASNMQLMPHRIRLREMEYDINYISGVATLPKYRNRGLVRDMFAFAFPEMQRRNQPISILIPFNYQFYEKFGYKQCYNKVFRYADSAPKRGAYTEKDLSPELSERLGKIYRHNMDGKSGYVIRTSETWKRILEDLLKVSKGRIIFHKTDGVDDGYSLISAGTDGGLELHEVCGNCELDFKSEVKPFAMARIIDVKRVLEDIATNFEGCWRIKVVDGDIPQNNKTLCVTKGKVTPCTEYDTEIGIGQLTQLVFGFIDDFTGTGLFPNTEPYINMIF